MAHDMEAYRQFVLRFFNPFPESVRMKMVSEQYSPLGAADLASYLSMTKFARPDVVIPYFSPEAHHISIFRQIMEISGWGDVNLVGISLVLSGSTLKMPGTFVMGTDGKNSLIGTIFLFQGVNLARSYLGTSRLARQSKSSNCLTGKEAEHGF